jgi:hypothetical protein
LKHKHNQKQKEKEKEREKEKEKMTKRTTSASPSPSFSFIGKGCKMLSPALDRTFMSLFENDQALADVTKRSYFGYISQLLLHVQRQPSLMEHLVLEQGDDGRPTYKQCPSLAQFKQLLLWQPVNTIVCSCIQSKHLHPSRGSYTEGE